MAFGQPVPCNDVCMRVAHYRWVGDEGDYVRSGRVVDVVWQRSRGRTSPPTPVDCVVQSQPPVPPSGARPMPYG